ncbi:PREDICTED: formin 6 [Prunus dulcis]|uniref:PREDICTED: formin 6 n=1 Tax=Prunus dulcis TaxID=3755 RepID=A0A5E4GPD5_PRUDU|nr:PREDICTED: formin 6 [Prunus dulcis]
MDDVGGWEGTMEEERGRGRRRGKDDGGELTKGNKESSLCLGGNVTLGTLSTLTFFLYHHRVKHPYESEKLVNGEGPDSLRCANDLRIPLSIFLYIGRVELSRTSTTSSEALRRE